jgi:hypothetical protein
LRKSRIGNTRISLISLMQILVFFKKYKINDSRR